MNPWFIFRPGKIVSSAIDSIFYASARIFQNFDGGWAIIIHK